MLQSAEKTIVSLNLEQCQTLRKIAHQEGQELESFIEQILQEVIEKRQAEDTQADGTQMDKNTRIQQNFDRIRRHREAFLARRNNQPLPIDTVALLEQIRDERDEHLLLLLKAPGS